MDLIGQLKGQTQDDNLLNLLITFRDENGNGFSDEEIIDEAMSFLFAGITPQGALAWALYFISLDRNVMKKLQEEVDQILEDQPPTPQDLPKLVFTKKVLLESMRLRPVGGILDRQASKVPFY